MRENKNDWSGDVKTALIALPILYVLSIGPVGYVVERLDVQDETAVIILRGFYFPLIVLHDHTPLEDPIDWYADQWRPDRP